MSALSNRGHEHRREIKVAALALHAAGQGYLSIANTLGVPESTVQYWLNGKLAQMREITPADVQSATERLAESCQHIAERVFASVTDEDIKAVNFTSRMTGAAIAIDKMRLLREQATSITDSHVTSVDVQIRAQDLARRFNVSPEAALQMLAGGDEP